MQCTVTATSILQHVTSQIANEIKNLFDDAGHGFVSWEGWHEMGNFFEGVGNKYLGWEGFRDMSDFFSDISRGFTRKLSTMMHVNWETGQMKNVFYPKT